MRLTLDKRFKKNIQGRFEKYEFEVGVLDDAPYKTPKRGERGQGGQDVLSSYAGGPVRQKTRDDSGQMISDVSKANRDRLGYNYLSEPFKNESSDIMRFTRDFFKFISGQSQKKRLENLLQAIVRNPMLRGEHGRNGALTRKIKGFNRPMIDTAQLFRAIKARVKVKRRV